MARKRRKKLQENQPRVRVRDAENAVFNPNATVQGEETDRNFGYEDDRYVTCFTVWGRHDYLDGNDYPVLGDNPNEGEAEERNLAFAKTVSINGRNPHYYIKRAANGRFFNPFGMDEGRHNKFIHQAGRKEFEYHEVGKRAFTFYLDFLKTKNLANLRNAERETF